MKNVLYLHNNVQLLHARFYTRVKTDIIVFFFFFFILSILLLFSASFYEVSESFPDAASPFSFPSSAFVQWEPVLQVWL